MNAPERLHLPDDGQARANRFRARLQETTQRLRSGRFWEAVHCFLSLEHPGDFDALLAVKAAEHDHDRLHDDVYPLVRKWFIVLKAWKAWERTPTAEAINNLKATFAAWENHPHREIIEQDVLYASLAGKAARLLIVVELTDDIRRTVGSL